MGPDFVQRVEASVPHMSRRAFEGDFGRIPLRPPSHYGRRREGLVMARSNFIIQECSMYSSSTVPAIVVLYDESAPSWRCWTVFRSREHSSTGIVKEFLRSKATVRTKPANSRLSLFLRRSRSDQLSPSFCDGRAKLGPLHAKCRLCFRNTQELRMRVEVPTPITVLYGQFFRACGEDASVDKADLAHARQQIFVNGNHRDPELQSSNVFSRGRTFRLPDLGT